MLTSLVAPFTLPFQCGNHAPILHLAACVKVSDAEREDSFAEALMRLQRPESVLMSKTEAWSGGVPIQWCAQSDYETDPSQHYRTKQQ